MDIPSEIMVTCEGGLGAARPFAIDIASQYITADTPEVTVTVISQEITASFPTVSQTAPPPHTSISRFVC